MKELSIEQKAKRYDEKLDVARHIYADPSVKDEDKYYIEVIFPELCESEDERIRKEIINYFEHYPNIIVKRERKSDYIAWLEKQGEIIREWSEMKINRIQTELQEMVDLKQKTEQGEQKPADKIEPKFKIGDWLVHKEMVGVTCCITQIHAPHYYLTNNNSFIKFGEEDNYHPWTIKDAKDGDVLSFDNECSNYHSIGIFKRIASKNEPNGNTYRCYVKYGGFKEKLEIPKNGDELYHSGTSAHPAVKEQRDLLFQKMKEAGYEWDAEKKEMKKIEQKSGWNEEDKNMLKWVTGYLDNKMLNTPIAEERTACKNAIAWLEKLKDKQKPNYCHHEVDLSGCSEEYCKAYYDRWNNCNQQHAQLEAEQKPAWSEEDIVAIDCAVEVLSKDLPSLAASIERLKYLRPQNRWKPSDEQMMQLERIAKQNKDNILGKDLMSLCQDLKNLRKE